MDSFLGRLGGAPGAHFGVSSEGLGGGFGTPFGFTILIYAGGRGKQPEQNGAESKQILIPTWKPASVALFSGDVLGTMRRGRLGLLFRPTGACRLSEHVTMHLSTSAW